jgi:prepilin-type N-terminal cleavage/methylation domain-containing protein
MNKRRAFTLIELLVVIAIIALLMAILMPALQRVKKQAQSVKCLAHLKQWNLIFAMYVEENDGQFPSGTTPEGWWWITQIDEKYRDWKNFKIWFCPVATKPLTESATGSYVFSAWGVYEGDEYGRNGIAGSYGLNGYVLSTLPGTTFEGGRSTNDNWRTPHVQNANEIPLFIGALRFDLWPIYEDEPPELEDQNWSSTNHMARCCINRHEGFVNSAFCDFSARKVGLKELWRLRWHKSYRIDAVPPVWPDWMQHFKEY